MDHIAIFDTTLRDREQSPGASMSVEQATGRGSSTDISEASARAYSNALNRYELLANNGRVNK